MRTGEPDPDGLVTIGRFIDPMAVALARSRLEADGLDCFVQGLGIGSLLPTATLFPILLQVREADAARALEILEELPDENPPREDPGRPGPG